MIDIHVHISSIEGVAASPQDAAQVLAREMERFGLDAVIVIPDNVPNPNMLGLEETLALAKTDSRIHVLGSPDILGQGHSQLKFFAQTMREGLLRGLKVFCGHDAYSPTDARLGPYLDLLQAEELPLVVHTGENPSDPAASRWTQPETLVELAQTWPHVRIVLAHLCWPHVHECFEFCHTVPNIHYDISGVAAASVLTRTGEETMREALSLLAEHCPDRLMFGSDWPMVSFARQLGFLRSLNLRESVLEQVLHENAERCYRLQVGSHRCAHQKPHPGT